MWSAATCRRFVARFDLSKRGKPLLLNFFWYSSISTSRDEQKAATSRRTQSLRYILRSNYALQLKMLYKVLLRRAL